MLLDGEIPTLEYTHNNLTIYYEENFNINYFTSEDMLVITHKSDDFFRVVSSNNTIYDCVLNMIVEFNGDKKTKVVCELGLDELTSGFATTLIPSFEKHVVFISSFTDEEKKELTLIENLKDIDKVHTNS